MMNVKRFNLIVIISVLLSGCDGEKVVLNSVTPPAREMRMLYKFRKDSLRIVTKYEYKYSRDTIRLVKYRIKFDEKRLSDTLTFLRKKYHDSLVKYPKIIRERGRVERKEIRAKNSSRVAWGVALALFVVVIVLWLMRK